MLTLRSLQHHRPHIHYPTMKRVVLVLLAVVTTAISARAADPGFPVPEAGSSGVLLALAVVGLGIGAGLLGRRKK